jgi:hypothetical protein
MTSHLKPLNTKKTTVCVVLNPGSGLGQAHSCDGIYILTQFKKNGTVLFC